MSSGSSDITLAVGDGDGKPRDQVFGLKSQVSRLVNGYVFNVIAAINAQMRHPFSNLLRAENKERKRGDMLFSIDL